MSLYQLVNRGWRKWEVEGGGERDRLGTYRGEERGGGRHTCSLLHTRTGWREGDEREGRERGGERERGERGGERD